MKTMIFVMTMLVFLLVGQLGLHSETIAIPPENFNEAGVGTQENPYQIGSLANLRWLSETRKVWGSEQDAEEHIKNYFIQTADIDAAETLSWNDGRGFLSIGRPNPNFLDEEDPDGENRIVAFTSDYDGGGFEIRNLFINNLFIESPLEVNTGLFGGVDKGNISNVHVRDIYIIESEISGSTGAIVGDLIDSSLQNSSATGIIIKNSMHTGGLVGAAYRSSIEKSYSNVRISSHRDYEDLQETDVIEIYNTGGLVGSLLSSSLRNSYYIGLNSAKSSFPKYGDLIGQANEASSTHHCYSINGAVYTVYGSINQWFHWTFPIVRSIDMSTVSLAQMQNQRTFTRKGFDFEKVWDIEPEINRGFPHFRLVEDEDEIEVVEELIEDIEELIEDLIEDDE